MTIYPYAVVPGPGQYGDGLVKVLSLHRTRSAAVKAARHATEEYRDDMRPYGGSSGYYYAAEWNQDGRRFWADAPPERCETGEQE